MIKLNVLYTRYIIMAVAFSIVGCKKTFLDVPSSTLITQQGYVTNLTTTKEYLNGVFIFLCRDLYYGDNLNYAELAADDIKPAPGMTRLQSQYNWSQVAGNELGSSGSNLNFVWISGYRVARHACFILESAERFRSENPAQADTLKGQALVLRVLAHWQLLNTFAQPYGYTPDASHIGIHYATTSESLEKFKRSSVREIYDKMISDLQNAIPLLPDLTKNNGTLTISRNAGKALLARLFHFKSDFKNAKNEASEIASNVPIMQTPDYPGKMGTNSESEALLQLPYETTNFLTNYPSYYFLRNPQFVATNDIVTILNEYQGDVRKKWIKNNNGSWLIVKFPPNNITTSAALARSYNFTVIRSSEMYLIAAECHAKLGNEDSARYYLNAIRKRSIENVQDITTTGPDLVDSILIERRRELCFENIRLFDLLRLGKSIKRLDAPSGVNTLPYPSNKAISPIPTSEILITGIEQNADY